MPLDASEWLLLLIINILTGVLIGILAKRIVQLIIMIIIISPINAIIIYYGSILLHSTDLDEAHAWLGLALPTIIIWVLPIISIIAVISFLLKKQIRNKNQ